MKGIWTLATLATVALCTPAHAQGDIRADGDWTHRGTGMVFPQQVGDAVRTNIHEYDADGNDASAGYYLKRGGESAFATIYIYPADESLGCAASFESMAGNVAQSYQDVERLETDHWASPSGTYPAVAFHTRFTMTGTLGSQTEARPLTSESYLFCPAGGKWLVYARATWPREQDFSDALPGLLHSLHWPATLDTPEGAVATPMPVPPPVPTDADTADADEKRGT